MVLWLALPAQRRHLVYTVSIQIIWATLPGQPRRCRTPTCKYKAVAVHRASIDRGDVDPEGNLFGFQTV
jgi:hypothetical protein